jgi:acetyl-CoA carboxylase carboxyltransferase component
LGAIQVETSNSLRLQDSASTQEIPVSPKKRIAAWKKWLSVVVAVGIVSQFYYFREMFAALLIFTILFLMCAAIAGAIYLVGRASQKGFSIAEPAARRGLVLAEVISRKTFHRPRSAPVQ